jgi:hypothetical protein
VFAAYIAIREYGMPLRLSITKLLSSVLLLPRSDWILLPPALPDVIH